jgi:hypothetical protein
MAIAGPFDRPIPGQSLTTEPRNNPWEQPPQMADIEDVTRYYIERLANQEVIDDFAAMIQAGAGLEPIVETTYMQGVMRGLHTLDAGIVVAPILHQFLKAAIEAQGVTVPAEKDFQAEADEAEMNRFLMVAGAYLERDDVEQDAGTEMLSEMVETQEETPVEEEAPTGLMAKG